MLSCRVCGDENAQYRFGKRQTLCDACNVGTPIKVSRAMFDRVYWKAEDTGEPVEEPLEGVKREFYEDYLSSELNLRDYIEATTWTR